MSPRTPAVVLLAVACAFAGCKPAKDQPEDPAAKASPAAAVAMASPPIGAVVSPGVAPPDRGVMSNAGGGVMSNAGGGVMSNAGGGLRPPMEGTKRPGSPKPRSMPLTTPAPGHAGETPVVTRDGGSEASAAPAEAGASPDLTAGSPVPAPATAESVAPSPAAPVAGATAVATALAASPFPASPLPAATPSKAPSIQVVTALRSHVFTVAGTFDGAMLVLVARDGATEYRGTVQAVSRTARLTVPEGRPLRIEVRNGLSGKRLAGPLEVVVQPGDDVVPLAF